MKVTDLPIEVGAVSVKLLDANPTRSSALFVNTHASNKLTLRYMAPAIAGSHIVLNPGGSSYEINRDNPWAGEVHAISNGAGTIVAVNEVSI